MKKIEKRQFDYIPDKVFKNLFKRDRDNLRSYRGTYRWYKDNDDKIKSLEKKSPKLAYQIPIALNILGSVDLERLRQSIEYTRSDTDKPPNSDSVSNFSLSYCI